MIWLRNQVRIKETTVIPPHTLIPGMAMDSLLDPVIDSSHRSYFAAVEHRALEVLRPRPPGEAISKHHDWVDSSTDPS